MVDNPFSMREFEFAINPLRKKSPGMDHFDYAVIRSTLSDLRIILLNIYNNLFAQGLFFYSWHTFLLILIPESDGMSVRPIALLSYFLKVFEKNYIS